jgi:RNA 2',3'-cyclic 3'-phosphodiesterase
MTRGGRWVDPHAGVPGRRLFVAVPLPDPVASEIADVVESVRSHELPAGAHDVRWVRLDGLHLTLRFLGPTAETLVEPTRAAVARVAASSPPIAARLAGAGTFPPIGRPRALWVGVSAGAPELGDLAARVNRELGAIGWPPEERAFRAHLTLARSDGVAVGRLVADRLMAAMDGRTIEFVVDRLGLFESLTGGGPARYVPVEEARLGAALPGPDVYHRDIP